MGRELIRIGINQGNMVTMVVTENNIRAILQSPNNLPADAAPHSNLKRMREKIVPLIAQGYSRIDDYLSVLCFYYTG